MHLSFLSNPETWVALLTLTALEIVLGIDNIVFISIMANELPPEQCDRARIRRLAAAIIMRIGLLLPSSFIVGLTEPLFTIPVLEREVSGRDLIRFVGGLFLIAKATIEIGERLEGAEHTTKTPKAVSLRGVIIQIML